MRAIGPHFFTLGLSYLVLMKSDRREKSVLHPQGLSINRRSPDAGFIFMTELGAISKEVQKTLRKGGAVLVAPPK